MNIGVLKEIKSTENRVLLVPKEIALLVQSGHQVMVESEAGLDAGFDDAEYERAGAEIIPSSEKIFKLSQLVLKVHPPVPIEFELFKKEHISFSFLTASNIPERAKFLLNQNSIFFSLELIGDYGKHHPVLASMSKIAANVAFIQATKYMEKQYGGKGIILSDINGIYIPKIIIIGAGEAGRTIVEKALKCGIEVHITDINKSKLNDVSALFNSHRLHCYDFSADSLKAILPKMDVVFSTVLQPGKKSPVILTEEDIKLMQPGSIFIDLAIDHGGSSETSRPTTHDEPIYINNDVVHYCVPNIPSAVPRTSSEAISQAVFPYIKHLADEGFENAVKTNDYLRNGLTFYHGKVANKLVAESLGNEHFDIMELLYLNI